MQFIVNREGKIEYSSYPLKKGLNIIGNVNGVMIPGTFEIRPLDENEDSSKLSQFGPDQLNGAAIFISLKDKNHFKWVSPDFSGICDVFWGTLPSGEHIIGDNFFDILSQFPSLTLNKQNTAFFINLGYFPPGKTFFKEISRVRVGNKLFLHNNNFIERNIWEDNEEAPKRDYLSFKKALLSVFRCNQINDDEAILLSGGCDSGLMAALSVLKFSKHPLAVTCHYKWPEPNHPGNARDFIKTKKIADFLGLKRVIVELDFNNESVTTCETYVDRAPLAPHWTLSYFKMVKDIINTQRVKKIWCGDPADGLYQLGASKDGLGDLIKRFYLSKNYIRSFPDIKDRISAAFLYRLGGELGNLAFRIKNGYRLRQAKNSQELLTAFEESEDLLALPAKKYNFKNRTTPLTSLEVKKILFERALQGPNTAGNTRTVYASADNFGTKAVLPYAATNMMHFFRGLEIGTLDVLRGKRFIRRYLKELLGDNNYKKLYCSFKDKDYHIQYIHHLDWNKRIIQHSKFGQELSDVIKKAHLPSFISYNSSNLHNLIHIYWFINVFKKAEGFGVRVKY